MSIRLGARIAQQIAQGTKVFWASTYPDIADEKTATQHLDSMVKAGKMRRPLVITSPEGHLCWVGNDKEFAKLDMMADPCEECGNDENDKDAATVFYSLATGAGG